MKKSSFIILGVITVFLSLWLILPLLRSGFFITDDGEWMLIRFTAFHQALVQGQLPVRWVGRLNFEYGYAVVNFLYPGYLYVAEVFHLLKISFIDSLKIVMGISLLSSGVFTFFWLRRFFSLFASWVGAVLYVLFPYHLYDLYGRGSVGELLALAVVPFVLWQIERKSFFFTTLSLGFLVLSHNTLAVLFLPLLLFYLFLRRVELKYSLKEIGFILLGGLGVSAFFWVPALYDLQNTVFSQTVISEWEKYFAPFALIGILPFLFFLVDIFYLKKNKISSLHYFFLGVLFFSLFLSNGVSKIVWEYLPVSFIQFPFRFLSLALLPIAFLAASLLTRTKLLWQYIAGAILIGISLFFAFPYAAPKEYVQRDDWYYMTNYDSTTVHQEYTPKWVTKKPLTRSEIPLIADRKIMVPEMIDVIEKKSHLIKARVKVDASTVLTYNHHYFPGWVGYVDGEKKDIQIQKETGIMNLEVPAGEHIVQFTFENTPIRLWSNIFSLLTGIIICVVAGRERLRKTT